MPRPHRRPQPAADRTQRRPGQRAGRPDQRRFGAHRRQHFPSRHARLSDADDGHRTEGVRTGARSAHSSAEREREGKGPDAIRIGRRKWNR